MPAPSRILLAVDSFEMSKPVCDMTLLSRPTGRPATRLSNTVPDGESNMNAEAATRANAGTDGGDRRLQALGTKHEASHRNGASQTQRAPASVARRDGRSRRMRHAAFGPSRRAFLGHHDRSVPPALFPARATRLRRSRACAVFNCGRLTLLDEVPSVRAVADARVAVLASGEGTNLQALLDDPFVGPWVVLAVSDRANARALERARSHEVETVFLDPSAHDDRVSFDRALLEVLLARSIDVVALAGFMRIVGPDVVRAFAGRILNVHPALLPAFPGTTSVADALAWGVKLTGVTVHFVDEEVDHGPIVFQDAVPVLPGDDWDSLEERVHEAEHRLLPAAIRALVEGRIRIEGRIVRVLEKAPA